MKSLICRKRAQSFLNKYPKCQRINFRSFESFQHPLNRRINENVEALIIGGGVIGVSTAYHLAKYGVENVVLLEKSELTSGSTWHAAGLVTNFQSSTNAKKINLYSIKLFKELEKETGQNVGLHTPGSLRLLTTPLRMDEAKYHMSKHHWNEAEQYLISPEKVMELCPILNSKDILGGIYNPGDGHIDPYSLTQALAIGARKYGAEIYPRSPVIGIHMRSDGKWNIVTNYGTLVTKHLINASGFYAADVCRMAGIYHYIPVIPIQHQYIITKELKEIKDLKTEIPVLRDLEGSYYLRQEKQGLLMGPYEECSRMDICNDWVHKNIPDFDKELFPSNLERIMPNIEKAIERVPILEKAEITSVVNGPISYNCQNSPLVGPLQGIPNFWQMICFGYGIIQSGGCGHYISHWIRHGEPPHELYDLDAERFGRWCTMNFALAKARESYGLNNSPNYPKEERWAGRPSPRCGPLYDTQKRLGAQMSYVSGFEKPMWYAKTELERGYKPSFKRTNWFSAMERECRGVIENFGLVDLSSFAKFIVTGIKSKDYLDIITSNNVPKIGTTCISHLLTPRGRVYAELTITHLEENRFLIVTGAASEFHDLWWMQNKAASYGYSEYVQIQNVTDSIGVLGIAGPRSRDFLQEVTGVDLSAKTYKFLQHRKTTVFGIDVDIIRISYTGELGWEIYCPKKDILDLYKRLQSKGESFNLINFGGFALNSLRIEKGFRMWSADMNMDTNPIEAGLGFFIKSKKKSDFVGKEAILEIIKQPLKRQIVFLEIDVDDVDSDGDESVFLGDKVIGNITSGSYGFQVKKSIAMAYLPKEYAKNGQEVDVDLLGNKRRAIVSLNPFVKIQPVIEKETLQ